MALETATYISQLNTANPVGSDPIASGDDHLRLIKSTLKSTFPNITGAVNVTQGDLNSIPDLPTASEVDTAISTALAAVNVTGRIRQSLTNIQASPFSVSSGSWLPTGHSITITPTSISSKILVMVLGGNNWNHNRADLLNNQTKIYRNTTPTAAFSNQAIYIYGADMSRGGAADWANSMVLLDSPGVTSALTYQTYITGEFDYGGAIMVVLEIL